MYVTCILMNTCIFWPCHSEADAALFKVGIDQQQSLELNCES